MSRAALTACVLVFGLITVPASLRAQEFGIYTRVFRAPLPGQAKAAGPAEDVVGRSISLFHAGKVYDHLGDEVIIFEPAHSRFALLNTSRQMATTVHQDEIRQLLKIARDQTDQHLASLREEETASALEALEQVAFTVQPAFDETLDEAARRLTLASRHLQYRVTWTKPTSPDVLESYLRYADWAARLNYVMHPHVLYPEVRLALNASLRRKGLLPVDVELHSDIGTPVHLRAEHKFRWELDSHDRSLINGWEQLLKNPTTKHVTFQVYQRTMLSSQTAGRR